MWDVVTAYLKQFFDELKIADYINVIVPLVILWLSLRHSTLKERNRYRLTLYAKYKYFLTMLTQFNENLSVEIDSWVDISESIKQDEDGFYTHHIPPILHNELEKIDKNDIFNYLDEVSDNKDFIGDLVKLLEKISLILEYRVMAKDIMVQFFERKVEDRRILEGYRTSIMKLRNELISIDYDNKLDGKFIIRVDNVLKDFLEKKNIEGSKIENDAKDYYGEVLKLRHDVISSEKIARLKYEMILLAEEAVGTINLHQNANNKFSSELEKCVQHILENREFIKKEVVKFETFLSKAYYPYTGKN